MSITKQVSSGVSTQNMTPIGSLGVTTEATSGNGVWTKIVFDEVLYGGHYCDLSNSRITAPWSGVYLITYNGQPRGEYNNNASAIMAPYVNGTVVPNSEVNDWKFGENDLRKRWIFSYTYQVALAAGDYVEAWYEVTGGSQTRGMSWFGSNTDQSGIFTLVPLTHESTVE